MLLLLLRPHHRVTGRPQILTLQIKRFRHPLHSLVSCIEITSRECPTSVSSFCLRKKTNLSEDVQLLWNFAAPEDVNKSRSFYGSITHSCRYQHLVGGNQDLFSAGFFFTCENSETGPDFHKWNRPKVKVLDKWNRPWFPPTSLDYLQLWKERRGISPMPSMPKATSPKFSISIPKRRGTCGGPWSIDLIIVFNLGGQPGESAFLHNTGIVDVSKAPVSSNLIESHKNPRTHQLFFQPKNIHHNGQHVGNYFLMVILPTNVLKLNCRRHQRPESSMIPVSQRENRYCLFVTPKSTLLGIR